MANRSRGGAAVTLQTAEFDATGRAIRHSIKSEPRPSGSGSCDAEDRGIVRIPEKGRQPIRPPLPSTRRSYAARLTARSARGVSGVDATTVFLYHGRQIIETRDGSNNVVAQFIHGTQYIDELVMGRLTDKGEFYYHQDANWNVIGLTTPGGDLAEEYNYTPYGRMVAKRHHAFGDADADGDVDAADNTAWEATQGGGGVYDRDFDADYDGDNDGFDGAAFDANYLAAGTSIEINARPWSPNGNPYTYTARRLDAESMLMHYRFRTYSPVSKVFLQRDALRYVDSSNLYEYIAGHPLIAVDPMGMGFWTWLKSFFKQSPGVVKKGATDSAIDGPPHVRPIKPIPRPPRPVRPGSVRRPPWVPSRPVRGGGTIRPGRSIGSRAGAAMGPIATAARAMECGPDIARITIWANRRRVVLDTTEDLGDLLDEYLEARY